MTNTRLTDPEILERRYPGARARVFDSPRLGRRGPTSRRRRRRAASWNSCGRSTLSLLTQRRGPHPPYGMAGGEPGALGRNRLVRADGSDVELAGIAQFDVEAGDMLVD